MENYMVIWEAAVPLFFLYYGIRLKVDPPKMGEKGLGTSVSRQSKEAWELAHAYGANVCLVMGGILLAAFILRLVLIGISFNMTFSLILLGIEFVCLMSLIPIIDSKVKRTFGDGKKHSKRK